MPTSVVEPLLSVARLESGHGKIRVLHGIDLHVSAGEVVALLGPNGAGKTTLLRALSGLLRSIPATCTLAAATSPTPRHAKRRARASCT